jgi:hypothetical protein
MAIKTPGFLLLHTATSVLLLTTIAFPVQAITFVSERVNLGSNDQIDWSSLGEVTPFNFLPNSFKTTSDKNLGLNVDIPSSEPGISQPFVFQTLPSPGIETNFSSGDFVLLTGVKLSPGSYGGNPGPISIAFDTPVLGAGTQIAVGQTLEPYTAFISAFDDANNLLGTFSVPETSSLALDNSAKFIGVSSDSPNIKRLVFSSSVPNRPLGINTLSIAAKVPEPSCAIALFIFGGLCLSRRKKEFES